MKSSGQNDDQFLNSSSWTATIVFLSFMLGFLIVSVGLSIYNTATNPIEFWIGPVGIYIANGASGKKSKLNTGVFQVNLFENPRLL